MRLNTVIQMIWETGTTFMFSMDKFLFDLLMAERTNSSKKGDNYGKTEERIF